MKKENFSYYDSFIGSANYAYEELKLIKDFFQNFNVGEAFEVERKVHAFENEADKLLHESLNYLVKDFIPPIDREVVDFVDEIAIDINIYNVEYLRHDVNKYIDLLDKDLNALVELTKKMKTVKSREDIKDLIVLINQLEEEADKLFQDSMKELYRNDNNAIEVNRWTIIYSRLEDCFDKIEDVSDFIDEIVMKNT